MQVVHDFKIFFYYLENQRKPSVTYFEHIFVYISTYFYLTIAKQNWKSCFQLTVCIYVFSPDIFIPYIYTCYVAALTICSYLSA